MPLLLDRPQEMQVLQVSCGRAHLLVLTDGEGVFSMGNNSYRQCGRKVVENEIIVKVTKSIGCRTSMDR